MQTQTVSSSIQAASRCCLATLALTTAAEAELSAFYAAVQISDGTLRANTAVELWLQIFVSASIDPCNLKRELRKVTIAAASLLAGDRRQPA